MMLMAISAMGLSPRVRGNLLNVDDGVVEVGSIPASAGEPDVLIGREQLQEVYPRECGGTVGFSATWNTDRGLSPRVRGNRWIQRHLEHRPRSIPASAGEPT